MIQKVSAQNIQTGNVSARSEVQTSVNGNGNVTTDITVEANGEKKELKATGAGIYKLEVRSPSSKSVQRSLPTPSPSIANKKEDNVRSSFILRIENLRKEIFKFFRSWFSAY